MSSEGEIAAPGTSVREIFEAALALPSEERAAFAVRACGDDATRLARVQRLLAAHEQAGDFLAEPAVNIEAGPDTERTGSRVGSYTLIERLGEGGFGAVFLAEQERPIRRKVALKIIKLGMDTRAVIARFEAERQVLAMMDHPGIAKVLDAGTTETGRPYFVMEVVKGEPIVSWCDDAGLDLRARLELFQQVCHAVQHAHQKGIIHRDLKPSNILVATTDGRPLPKIIDFGIAKAMSARLTDATLLTEHRQLVGTPQYMSPEQAEGSQDIDTRTDVYSLGVLLYELLTGTTPFDAQRLRSASLPEVQRIIREEEPPRPSTRVALLKSAGSMESAGVSGVGAERLRLRGERLHAQLRGDLDWVVMRAIEKERALRYETADALSMDIGRHLRGEAVVAAPPSRAYRTRKFLRRHRPQVIAAILVAASLLAAVVGTSTFAVRAARRAGETNQVASFQAKLLSQINVPSMGKGLRDDLMKQAEQGWRWSGLSEDQVAGRRVELERQLEDINFTSMALGSLGQNVFDRALADLDSNSQVPPLVRAVLLQQLASTMGSFGLNEKALKPQRDALEIRLGLLGKGHPDTLAAQHAMAALMSRNWPAEAEPYARAAYEGRVRVLRADDADTLASMRELGSSLLWQSRYEEAESYLRGALAAYRRTLGDDNLETLDSMRRLAQVLLMSGRVDEAEPVLEEALGRCRRVFPDDALTYSLMGAMANLRLHQGRPQDAEPLYRQAAEALGGMLGEDNLRVLFLRDGLGNVLAELGRYDEAEAALQGVHETRRRLLGRYHIDSIAPIWTIAWLRERQGRLDEAEAKYREALEDFRELDLTRAAGPVLFVAERLTDLLDRRERHDEATEIRARYVREFLDSFPASNGEVGRYISQGHTFVEARGGPHPWPVDDPQKTGVTSRVFILLRQIDDGGVLQREFVRAHGAKYGVQDTRTLSAMSTLAWYLWDTGNEKRRAEAEPWARQAVAGLRAMPLPPQRELVNALATCAVILRDRGGPAEALALFEEVGPLIERGGTLGRRESWIRIQHADCLVMLARFKDAERLLLADHARLSAASKPDAVAVRPVVNALVRLHDAWQAAEPAGGHDAEASRWRAQLDRP